MNILARLERADARRANIPGEHWLALAAGVGLWVTTRKLPSTPLRLLTGIGAGMLVARALSGRDVPRVLERAVPHAE
jgi:hypothetical protein